MRRTSFTAAILGAFVSLAPLVHGAGVRETFNEYPGPFQPNWYYMLNNNPTGVVAPVTNLGGGDMAAYIPVNSALYGILGQSSAVPSTLYFETSTLNPALTAQSFTSAIGVVAQDSPAASVSSIEYYLYVDTLLGDGITPGQDGLADSYYISTLSLAGSPEVLQTYPTRSLVDNVTPTWSQYDWNGSIFAPVGTVNNVPTSITDQTIFLGLQFDLLPLTGTNYLTIYVDDVMVVPEPSAMLLACFGVLGIFARRSRRQDA